MSTTFDGGWPEMPRRGGAALPMLVPLTRRPTPPRVDRTFAFVDLCGFTNFADDHGDDAAADELHLLRAGLRASATNHGVRIDKWIGDGAMLVGVEAPALLAAVVEAKWALHDGSRLPLRAGLAAGPVMVFDGDDYVGGPVNLAAKLCDLAEPGQCLASAELAEQCPVGLVVSAVGPRYVPGFHRPVELVEINASGDRTGDHRRGLGAEIGKRMRPSPDDDKPDIGEGE